MIYKPNEDELKSIGTKAQRQVWAKALRSGTYEQFFTRMCDPTKFGTACCLHVAAIEVDNIKWEDGFYALLGGGGKIKSFGTPCNLYVTAPFANHAAEAGFACFDENGIVYGFVEMNDELHFTFDQIADILEGKEVNTHNIGDYA